VPGGSLDEAPGVRGPGAQGPGLGDSGADQGTPILIKEAPPPFFSGLRYTVKGAQQPAANVAGPNVQRTRPTGRSQAA
jgi:hypothetical protein